MSQTGQFPRRLPKIGMRNIKTALAAALCAFFYYFLDRSPAFACIGAIFGMGSAQIGRASCRERVCLYV